jgi:hypothetical protein
MAARRLADDRAVQPVVYLISGFRWSFFGMADVPVGVSLLAIAVFTGVSLAFRGLDLPHGLAAAEVSLAGEGPRA